MELQDKVFQLTAKIPKGKVTTYGIIAQKLVHGRGDACIAPRAVGNALHKNRDFAKIPCHRVVRSDGSVGGYVLGVKKKIAKLRSEGVKIKKGRIINFKEILHKF